MPAKQKSISVTDEQWTRVERRALANGTTPSAVLRDLCMDHLPPSTEEWKAFIDKHLNTNAGRRRVADALGVAL